MLFLWVSFIYQINAVNISFRKTPPVDFSRKCALLFGSSLCSWTEVCFSDNQRQETLVINLLFWLTTIEDLFEVSNILLKLFDKAFEWLQAFKRQDFTPDSFRYPVRCWIWQIIYFRSSTRQKESIFRLNKENHEFLFFFNFRLIKWAKILV